MTATHRYTVLLIPSILAWAGCATSALQQGATTTLESTVAQSEEPSAPTPSRMVAAEAALIRQTALERGFSEDEAGRIEESVIHAQPQHREFLTRYIHAMNRFHEPDEAAESPAMPPRSPNAPLIESAHVVSPASFETTKRAAVESDLPENRDVRRSPTTGAIPIHPTSATAGAPAVEIEPPDRPPAHVSSRPDPVDQRTGVRHSLGDEGEEAAAANRTTQIGSASDRQMALDGSETDEGTSWQRQVRAAIAQLEEELAEGERNHLDPLDEMRLRACLSLLQLATDNPDQAMDALEGLDDHQLEFWRQSLMGLGILIDAEELPKMRHRVESAVEHLDNGLTALSTLGPLRVKNIAFVNSVRSFGVYTEMGNSGFKSGEDTLLYVEIENFQVDQISSATQGPASSRRRSVAENAPMYEAELLGRYEILDQDQRIVMSRTFKPLTDRCRQRRRDFFVAYPLTLPKLAAGDYLLELTIEDKKGGKFGSGTIDFRIR